MCSTRPSAKVRSSLTRNGHGEIHGANVHALNHNEARFWPETGLRNRDGAPGADQPRKHVCAVLSSRGPVSIAAFDACTGNRPAQSIGHAAGNTLCPGFGAEHMVQPIPKPFSFGDISQGPSIVMI